MHAYADGHSDGYGSFAGPEDGTGPSASLGPVADDRGLAGSTFASVGDWLAARRRALKMSLEDVAEATRVRLDYLSAIEDMDPRRMPAGPYAPGFVRTYAIHLELDPDTVTARFREEMSPSRLRTPRAEPAPQRFQLVVPRRVWGGALTAAALAGLVAFGMRPPPSRDDLITVPAVPEGLSEWVAADIQSRRTSAAPELVVGPDLALRARVPVRIEARVGDGEVLISRSLAAGEVWLAPRVPGVRVSADNGAAVEILLDGAPQGRLGPAGLPVTNWMADLARPLTRPMLALPPETGLESGVGSAAVSDASQTLGAEGEAEAAAAQPADESAAVLSDFAAEDALVVPDLLGPEIADDTPPPTLLDDSGFTPDPDEAAALGPAGLGPTAIE